MKPVLEALAAWSGRMSQTRWARWLEGRSATGPCTWRVTCRARSWSDLWGRVAPAVRRAYPPADGFIVRAFEYADPAFGGIEVFRGRTGGLIVAGQVTGQDSSSEAEVRLGVGRWSRLADWASTLTFATGCLLTLGVVACLLLIPWVRQAPGGLLAVLIFVAFLVSFTVAGVVARFTVDAVVGAVERLGGQRLSDSEFDSAVKLVRGAAEEEQAAVVVRDGW